MSGSRFINTELKSDLDLDLNDNKINGKIRKI